MAVKTDRRFWLINTREVLGFCQKDAAKKIGISSATLSIYESGKATPKPRMAKKIGDALGFDWHRFYQEKDQPMVEFNEKKKSEFQGES